MSRPLLVLALGFILGTAAVAAEPPETYASGTVDGSAEIVGIDEFTNPDAWYFLGCGRFPRTCLMLARRAHFHYWVAQKEPWRCGRIGWACYGRF